MHVLCLSSLPSSGDMIVIAAIMVSKVCMIPINVAVIGLESEQWIMNCFKE